MAIIIYANNATNAAVAESTPQPRNVWYNVNYIVVKTQEDYEAPYVPPVDPDLVAARAYAKLTAMRNMTPAQTQTWIVNNVTNLATAQDAILTLAIGYIEVDRRLRAHGY